MKRMVKRNPKKVGTAPGTFVHVGRKLKDDVDIISIDYNEQSHKITSMKNAKKIIINNDKDKVHWINVIGLHDTELISQIGKAYGLHKLVIEDVLNTGERIKIEDYGNYLFIVLKLLLYDKNTNELESRQLSLVFKGNTIISFLEADTHIFDNVIARIKPENTNMRRLGADYLLYALIDAIVDSFSVTLEKLGDKIDSVEDRLVENPEKEILKEIYALKREILFMRNSSWPSRSVMDSLLHLCSSYFTPNTEIYLRDVYDHIMRINDTTEIYRDMLSNMLDTYLSSISNKTNETMKVLTIISVIFIPITCLAGIYGMNFRYMPELNMPWGYAMFWIISVVITILMIRYFKKKNWI